MVFVKVYETDTVVEFPASVTLSDLKVTYTPSAARYRSPNNRGIGVAVGTGVRVGVGVGVGFRVAVGAGVGDGIGVGLEVGVGAGVGIGVAAGTGVVVGARAVDSTTD